MTDVVEEHRHRTSKLGFYQLLSATGGFTLYNPDKMIDYSKTPQAARYAFTFWAFPRQSGCEPERLPGLRRAATSRATDSAATCRSARISFARTRSSLLSYTHDGDIISLDPIHAPGDRDKAAWADVPAGIQRLGSAPGRRAAPEPEPVRHEAHVVAAYGERWQQLSEWVRSVDPDGRMLNPFFADLLA